jgi:very-short-patch-repair endonuclease
MRTDIDQILAAIAAPQYSAFAREQVRGVIDARCLRTRTRSGLLVVETKNVLRFAAAPRTDEQRIKMATLDVPGGAVASHLTAAWLWGFPGFPLRGVEVTARRSQFRPSVLAWVHHPRLLLPDHITVHKGIEVTSVALTIYNVAGRIHPDRLNRLVVNVCKRSRSVHEQLHDLLPLLAERGRNGIGAMRVVLARWPRGCTFPDSGQEIRFEDLMAASGITGLRRQVDLGGHEWIGRVDYLCELTGVIFEIDSELHHTAPEDVAADEVRDAALTAAGHPEVVRIWAETLWSKPWTVPGIVRAARARQAGKAA